MSFAEPFAVTSGQVEPGTETFELRLYIAGQSPSSIRAIENLRQVCERYLPGRYKVEVIDLMIFPKLARGDEIIAVPTLVCLLPQPVRRVVGDLSDTERVLVGLQLRPDLRCAS
jgi:circadian clock protein KaiB